MEVKLTYFKPSGKYYTHTEYNSKLDFSFDIYDEVRTLNRIKKLPGLIEGAQWEGNILVEPIGGVPALVVRYKVEDTLDD